MSRHGLSAPDIDSKVLLWREDRSGMVADIKAGEPFGLDTAALGKIDWALALKRVIHDLRSDFIYAPHISFIYSKAGDALIALLKSELKSGKFSPGIPLTIEVPKR